MKMSETYKEIIGYEGHYQISNLCDVKSIGRTRKSSHGSISNTKERILKAHTNRGYRYVTLYKWSYTRFNIN